MAKHGYCVLTLPSASHDLHLKESLLHSEFAVHTYSDLANMGLKSHMARINANTANTSLSIHPMLYITNIYIYTLIYIVNF